MKDLQDSPGFRKLSESVLPEIAKQLKRIADEMHRANQLKAQKIGVTTPADIAKEFMENKDEAASPLQETDDGDL